MFCEICGKGGGSVPFRMLQPKCGDQVPVRLKQTLRGDFAKYLSGNVGSQLVSILRNLVIPIIVSPSQYGLWRIILVVWEYSLYLHLGTFALLNRDLPKLTVTGERFEHKRIRQTSLWGSLLVVLIAVTGLFIWSLLPKTQIVGELPWALRICGIGIIGQQLVTYHTVILRTRSEFGRVSIITFVNALVGSIFAVLFSLKYGVVGLTIGTALGFTVVGVGAIRWSLVDEPVINLGQYGRLVLGGIPLSALPLMSMVMSNIGVVIATSVLGLLHSGYYGIGMMFGTFIYAVPQAVGMILYPTYLEVIARSKDPRHIGLIVRKSLRITGAVSAIAVSTGFILAKPLLGYWLPRYLPGLTATYIQLAMMPFIAYIFVLHNAILALQKHWAVLLANSIAIIVNIILALLGAYLLRNVTGIALGVFIANVLFSISVLWMTLHWTQEEAGNVFLEIFRLLEPLALMGLLTLGLMLVSFGGGTVIADLTGCAIRVVIACAIGMVFLRKTWKAI